MESITQKKNSVNNLNLRNAVRLECALRNEIEKYRSSVLGFVSGQQQTPQPFSVMFDATQNLIETEIKRSCESINSALHGIFVNEIQMLESAITMELSRQENVRIPSPFRMHQNRSSPISPISSLTSPIYSPRSQIPSEVVASPSQTTSDPIQHTKFAGNFIDLIICIISL